MNGLRYTATLFLSLSIAACSSEADNPQGNTGGGGSGGSNAGGSNAGGEASGGHDTGGGGASGESCDATRPCGQGEYCDFPDSLCGAGEPMGTCVAAPQTDCGPESTVCGCDGQVYTAGGCAAALAGVDVGPAAACTAPEGTLACGQGFCDKATQYCRTLVEIGADSEECAAWTQCEALPACEGSPSLCACIETEGPDNFGIECTGDETSGVSATVTTPDCQ